MVDDEDYPLTQEQEGIMYRAAGEGIPVGAIARVLKLPFSVVSYALKIAQAGGLIVGVPRADWPGNEHWDNRTRPALPGKKDDSTEIEFACRQHFRLTSLEAGFVVALLRRTHADKAKLHAVIEDQRQKRATRPNEQEATDPKMVDVMICKLRKKLEMHGFPGAIQTLWGNGYFIEPDTKLAIYKAVGLENDNASGPGSSRGSVAAASA